MYKLLFTISIIFLFNACSQLSHNEALSKKCILESLRIEQHNTFCSAPRSALLDDNYLYIGFDDGLIAQWDLDSNKLVRKFEQNDFFSIQQLIKYENKIYAASKSMKLKKFSLNGNIEQEKNYEKGSLFCLENTNNFIYAGFGNTELGVINLNSLELDDVKQEHQYLIYSLYKEKQQLLSGGDDNRLVVWNIDTNGSLNKEKSIDNFSSSIRKITKYRSSTILGLGDGTLIQLDNNFNQHLYKSNSQNFPITALIATKEHLVSGDSSGQVIIWEESSKRLKTIAEYKLDSTIKLIIEHNNSYLFFTKKGFIQKITHKQITTKG